MGYLLTFLDIKRGCKRSVLVTLKNKQGMSSTDILANRLFKLQSSLRTKCSSGYYNQISLV